MVSEVGIDFPCHPQRKPQLVLCRDRLFCVTVVENRSESTTSIDICKILIARKECVWLAAMPLELVGWVEGDDVDLEYGHFLDDIIVASGSADNFRKDPCFDPCSDNEEYQELCESNYCPSLCPV